MGEVMYNMLQHVTTIFQDLSGLYRISHRWRWVKDGAPMTQKIRLLSIEHRVKTCIFGDPDTYAKIRSSTGIY